MESVFRFSADSLPVRASGDEASGASIRKYSSSAVLMAGAKRKQSNLQVSKMAGKQEKGADVPRENVFLFVPNLIGTCMI